MLIEHKKTSQLLKNINEKRTLPRHKATIPVSIRCGKAANDRASWHIGEATNMSVNGLSIKIDPFPETHVSSVVQLFCLPRENSLPPGILDPEPVWMTGQIIWLDKENYLLGVKIIS